MEKRLAILHANCQGDPLVSALLASPEFSQAYTPKVFLNYARQEIPQADMDACGLFLYQYLGADWSEFASEALIKRLPPSCPCLCIPNMFFKAPWPFWSGAPGFDNRDTYLEHLLGLGLPGQDILHVYLRTSLTTKYDLGALFDQTIALERSRQAHTPVPYLDYVLEHYRERPLFHTVNHPTAEMLALAASGILRELGMQQAPDSSLPTVESWYQDFFLPIHPQVAAFHGLAYGGEGERYPVYGRSLSFARYAAAYVECRTAGIDNFLGYLQMLKDTQ